MKIIQKRKECIGCGNCVDFAPHFWVMDKSDGLASLIGAEKVNGFYVLEIDEDPLEENKLAASVCPVKVIKVEMS